MDINFNGDIEHYIGEWYRYLNISIPPKKNIQDDLINALTLQEKYIFPQPRKVDFSKELITQLDNDPKHLATINYLKLLLLNGANVNPHQSKRLFDHEEADNLIFDWKIYHLHLSTQKTNDPYFVDRTRELVFVYVDQSRALFLGFAAHKPNEIFADKKWLEIIDNNWSDVLFYPKGINGLSHDLTNSERLQLRNHQINAAFVEINGKIVAGPNMGIASSGHSNTVVDKMLNLYRWTEWNAKEINKNKTVADRFFSERHNIVGEILYKVIFSKGPQIIDANSGTVLLNFSEQYQFKGS